MMARPRSILWLGLALVAAGGLGVAGNALSLATADPANMSWRWGLFLLLKLGILVAGLLILAMRRSGLWLFGLSMAAGLAIGLFTSGAHSPAERLLATGLFLGIGLGVAAAVRPHWAAMRGWPAMHERLR